MFYLILFLKPSYKPHISNISEDNLWGINFKIFILNLEKQNLTYLFNILVIGLVSFLLSKTSQQELFQILKVVILL